MPDNALGLRPVVRKVSTPGIGGTTLVPSASHKDLASRFERNSEEMNMMMARSTSSSSLLSRSSRPGSVKGGKTQRDQALENKVLNWIVSILDDTPATDYEHYIQDGSILSKVMTQIVFNSVPMEDIDQTWGANPAFDRVNSLIREIKRYGVVDVFEAEDLIELRNIPKVTKCLAQLSKLAASDKENLLNCYA